MYRRQRGHLYSIWWSNLEILVGPLHRSSTFIGELRCQAIQTEHGPYITERTQKAVYIVICLWLAQLRLQQL
jgi:membrane protein YdbS with pleckstrin-like domain